MHSQDRPLSPWSKQAYSGKYCVLCIVHRRSLICCKYVFVGKRKRCIMYLQVIDSLLSLTSSDINSENTNNNGNYKDKHYYSDIPHFMWAEKAPSRVQVTDDTMHHIRQCVNSKINQP